MLKLLTTTAAAALLALSVPAVAQTQKSETRPSAAPSQPSGSGAQTQKSKLDSKDEKFAKEAAMGGMAEVELSKMAQQKAQSPEVKKLAETIVKDHETANAQLMAIASGKGVELPKPGEMKGDHKKMHDKLAKANGAEFDREYVKGMVDDHKKDIKAFEDEAKDGKDAELKQFASQTAPKLKEHLQMAEQAQKSMAGSQTSQDRRNDKGGTAGSSPAARSGATGSSQPGGTSAPATK